MSIQCIEMSVRPDDFPIIGFFDFHRHKSFSSHQIVARMASNLKIQNELMKTTGWLELFLFLKFTNVAVTVSLGLTNGYGCTRQSPNSRSNAGLSKTTPETREIWLSSKNGGDGPSSKGSF